MGWHVSSLYTCKQEKAMTEYYVQIINCNEFPNIEKTIGPMTERKAEKVKDGVDINLDHENYVTRIMEAEPV
jgi:hypothetical protein